MNKIYRVVIFVLLILIIGNEWAKVLRPETSIFDGRNETTNITKQGFDDLPKDSLDYLVLGSSNVFMNINPIEIMEKYNYYGYDYATPVQPIYLSEYYLKDALKTQSPRVVILDALGIGFYEDSSEEYTHLSLDYMDLDKEKIEAISYIPYDKEEYYFDFMKYHSRWESLFKDDLDSLEYNDKENFLGYVPAYTTAGVTEGDFLESGEEVAISSKVKDSFARITKICENNGIKLVVIKTPRIGWTEQMSLATNELCLEYDVDYYDFNMIVDELELDINGDFCDGGSHLNEVGANKVSDYLGNIVSSYIGVHDNKKGNIVTYYNKRCEAYNHFKEYNSLVSTVDVKEYFSKAAELSDYIYVCGDLYENEAFSSFVNEYIGKKLDKRFFIIGTADNNNFVLEDDKEIVFEDNKFFIRVADSDEGVVSEMQFKYQNYGKGQAINIFTYDSYYDEIIDSAYIVPDETGFEIWR